MAGVKTRLVQASGASGLSLLARMLEQVLLVPVLLAAWSVDLFGEWLLISAIPIYLSLLDFGVVQSGSNELARRAGDGDAPSVRRFFRDYASFFMLWSLVLFAVLSAFILVSPVAQWFKLSLIGESEAKQIFILLMAGTLVSQNSLTLIGGMRARKMLPAGLLIRAAGAFLRLGAAFLAVTLLDAGPIALAAILLASRLLEYAAQAILLARANLAPPLNPFRKRNESLHGLVASGLEFLLFPLAQAMVLQGAVVVVGLLLGSTAVAIFATHRTLSRATSQLVQLVVIPLRAEAGLLQSDANRAELRHILLAASRLTFWAALASAAILLLVGGPLFNIWTGGKIAFLPTLFAGLIIATVLEAVWSVAASIRLGSNRHRPLAWGYLGSSALGLIMMLWLTWIYGLNGTPWALVFAEFAMAALTIPLTAALVDLKTGDYLKSLMTFPGGQIRQMAALFGRKEA